jgi:histidyl-tRNA synthetase
MKTQKTNPMLNTPILSGMSDTNPKLFRIKKIATSKISELLYNNGYEPVDSPILEPTELYVKKSGGDISDKLYSFSEPGGTKVSLRPEFTSSIIRSLIEDNEIPIKPHKLQYCGPVFRYNNSLFGTELKQFTQQGCELIGESNSDSDAEIIRLALQSLSQFQLNTPIVTIGNIGSIRDYLFKQNIGEALIEFTLSNIGKIGSAESGDFDEVIKKAESIGLITDETNTDEEFTETSINNLLQIIVSGTLSNNSGRRTIEQITTRLIKKKTSLMNTNTYKEMIQTLADFLLSVSTKSPEEINPKNANPEFRDSLEYMQEVVSKVGIIKNLSPKYQIQFEKNRGFTYYTGILFDLEIHKNGDKIIIGGGGRYDNLIRSLGANTDCPAIGFAINIDEVINHIQN